MSLGQAAFRFGVHVLQMGQVPAFDGEDFSHSDEQGEEFLREASQGSVFHERHVDLRRVAHDRVVVAGPVVVGVGGQAGRSKVQASRAKLLGECRYGHHLRLLVAEDFVIGDGEGPQARAVEGYSVGGVGCVDRIDGSVEEPVLWAANPGRGLCPNDEGERDL